MKAIYLIPIILLLACTKQDPGDDIDTNSNNGWIIDTTKMTGTQVTESFPVATNPSYTSIGSADHVNDSERVVVFKLGGSIYIYPINMLGVEVINGSHDNANFAVTYCPRTQTTYVVNTRIDGKTLQLKGSGVLYSENLVYYDVNSDSYWSQMLFKCIKGEYENKSLGYIHSFETIFSSAKKYFPFANVLLDFDTSFKSSHVINTKNTPRGNTVLGLVNNSARPGGVSILDYTSLESNGVIKDRDIIIAFDKSIPYIVAFRGESITNYTHIDEFPTIIQDGEGNKWNVFGERVYGSGLLAKETFYLAYYWAWEGMFTGLYYIEGQGEVPRDEI